MKCNNGSKTKWSNITNNKIHYATTMSEHTNMLVIRDIQYKGRVRLCVCVCVCVYIYIQQNKGKESENSYRKFKRSQQDRAHTNTWKLNRNILMDKAVFLNQKRANVCEHMTKMASLQLLKGATRGLREEWMEGNLKRDYLRLMPGLYLVDRTNWKASSRWRRVLWLVLGGKLWSKRTFQQELKGSWVRSRVDSDWKG